MQSSDWTKDLVDSLVKGHSLMDPSAWAPPNPFLLDPLFEDLWLEKVLKFKALAAERGISYRAMADALPGPACVRKEFRYAIWGGKLHGIGTEKIVEVLEFYRDILLIRAPADPFCLHNAFWHSEEDLHKIFQETSWQEANPDSKKIIGRISANCPPLAWGLLTDFFYHRAYELYGLYQLPQGETLLIRQYGPFRIPEVWRHTSGYKFNQIIIKCVYDNLQGDFDYINHFTTVDNIPEKLKRFSFEVDGKQITGLSEMKKFNDQVMQMAVAQDKHLRSLDAEGQKRLTVLAKHYDWMELFALAGLDWYPSEKVFSRFIGEQLLDIKFHKMESGAERKVFWREIFDPFGTFSHPEIIKAQREMRALNGV